MKPHKMSCVIVRFCRWGAILGLVTGFGIQSAWAEGFRNPPEGGASMGRVGGNIALDEDASAVSRNPANLVLLPDARKYAPWRLSKSWSRHAGQFIPVRLATSDFPEIWILIL